MSASATQTKFDTLPILRSGKWTEPTTSRFGDVFNPSTGQVIARVPFCDATHTGEVVAAAATALPAWAETPVVERARVMFRFRTAARAFRRAGGTRHP